MNYQERIMNSILAKPVKELQAFKDHCSILTHSAHRIENNKTVYCISPYKTGTTFLAASYPKTISQHEPMQYLSLKTLDKTFDTFFIRRLNTLNLKLECSGFLSAYVSDLASHKLAKDFEYISVARKPSSWINSVVNYWAKLDYLQNDYINTYFWKGKVGVDLLNFKLNSKSEQDEIVEKLALFYMDYTKQSQQLKNMTYVYLKDVENYLSTLDTLINEKAQPKQNKRNSTKVKFYTYKNDTLDADYEKLISKFQKSSNSNNISL